MQTRLSKEGGKDIMANITKKQIQCLLYDMKFFKNKTYGYDKDYWLRYRNFKENSRSGWWVEYKEENNKHMPELKDIIVGYCLGRTIESVKNNLPRLGHGYDEYTGSYKYPCDEVKVPIFLK